MAKKEKVQEQQPAEELAITPAPEAEIQPVQEPVEEPERDERPRQSAGDILRRLVLATLRLILTVVLIGGCGAAIYFGAPFVYEQFVRPVEENTSQLNDLNFRQSQSEIQITDLQTRLATLEAAQTPQSDSITQLDSHVQTIDARVQTLEGADAQRNESLVELTYQSDLLRAMELLSRARVLLYQSNFGLARLDVQAARDVLAELQPDAPESKQKDLTEALFRLDLALKNLPDFPVAASDDLDIAWQVLMDGYPAPVTATPTLVPTLVPENTPTLVPESTATPTAIP